MNLKRLAAAGPGLVALFLIGCGSPDGLNRGGNLSGKVLLDGKPVGGARGADVGADGSVNIDRSGMYRLVAKAPRARHMLTLTSSDPGLRVYVFTFGP